MSALKKGSTGVASCGSTSIPAGPVYYPNEDEFKDPLEYIYKIRPEAEPYGICRIVPPKGWNPPFALDLDNFAFPTKTQAIHKLQARPASCDSKTFELEYSRFLQDHCGKKSKKRAVFEGEDLDLCKLFNAVKRFGGYDKVVDGKKWGDVARFLRPAGKVSDCAKHVLCQLYREHLYDYEEFYSRMNQGMSRSCKKGEQQERKSDQVVQSLVATKRHSRSGSGLNVKDCKVHVQEEHDQICEQCRSGLHGEVMLLCDRCDKGWHIYCLSPPLEKIPQGNWYCFSCLNSDRDSFGFVPGKQYSLEAFRRMAERSRKRWFGSGPVSRVHIEKKFWEIIEGSVGEVEVMYGNDLDTSVCGSGFPRVTDQKPQSVDDKLWKEYSTNPWNLNNLSKLKGSMLRAVHQNITGVMVPWLYIGMLFSSFCWHFEDHCFYSMNYLHWGEPKCWYSVPGSDASAFEKVMRSSLPDLFDAQPDLLFQLVTMLNPTVLQENGVPVHSILQEPGNFVITFPRSYHGGFNLGLNCAEAVNFAPADWLPFGAFGADIYKRYHKPAVLSHEELLCVVAQYGDVDSRASFYLKKELLRISDKEKSWREKLWKNGIVKSSCMSPRECPQFVGTEEDQTCIICQQYLYLSAVVCSCRPSSFVCLEHWEHLCECKTVKLRLLYCHSLAELFDLAFFMEKYSSEDKAEIESVRRQSSCPVALTKKVNGICIDFNQIAAEWLLQSRTLLQNPFSSDAFVNALRKAEQFLWAGSEMDSVRDMVKTLIEAQKWAEGIRDCVTKIEFWYKDSSLKKVHLDSIDELLRFHTAPCNEPHYHKLKEYTEDARLLVQEIGTALSICSKMSELENLYSRACGLPIYVKEIKQLEGKISSTKAWLDSVRKCISVKNPIVIEVNDLYKLKSEIADLQVRLPEIDMLHSLLSQVESCSVQCREVLEGPMNLENVGKLLKKWDDFTVDVAELQLLRKYHSDAVSWVSYCNDVLGRVHVDEDQTYTVNELMHIFKEGSSLKIQVDKLPLVEVELKKAKCREKALKACDLKMPLEFIQQLLEEATVLQIDGEKLFVNLSSVLSLAIPWEERAREILSHESPVSDFEDMIRASENIFTILPSLNDVMDALSKANSWLGNSKPYLVPSSQASNSLRKVEDLQVLVSQSKLLKISLEERRMLQLVLKNCILWECEASSLLDDAQCLFELDNSVKGISSGLMCKVEVLIARTQSTIRSGVSLGFDFKEISKLKASCSTLQWCKRALSFSDCCPPLEDILEVADGLSHSCGSGALLKVLVDGVEWLRRALESISGPRNCRRCKMTDVRDILNDYQTINMSFAAVYCQLQEAIKEHELWQEQVQHFFGPSYGERSWSSLLQLKELGNSIAFSCSELNLILSEVEKVENWKKTCINNIGISVQNENSLLDVLEKIKKSLERSLSTYGKMQDPKEQNLCICCFIDSEDQELLTCSTCMDCYHLRCIALMAKDTGIENYKCPYCKILKGESHYPSGGGLLRFGKKHVELKVLIELQSDAEHMCLRIDERDVLNQLVEKALACKSLLRKIVNLASATVGEDISIISEKLTLAVKASEVAGVWDQQDNCDLELALAKNLWKIQVNRLLDGVRKPTIQQIQKHMNEGLAMEISLEDHYMLKLTNVNCLGLQWAELAKKVAMDSGALSLDKVYELRMEGENLPVDVDEELKMLTARCMLYCICRKPFNRRTMIACDLCNEWYHFDCMKLPHTQQVYVCPACNPCTEESPTNHERLTSARFVEPKTPSPRHTNPRKKQRRDVPILNYKMLATGHHDGSNFRYSSGIECLRWQNRKPFRRASKKRVEFRIHSPFLCTQP